jgi:hypothetical protein
MSNVASRERKAKRLAEKMFFTLKRERGMGGAPSPPNQVSRCIESAHGCRVRLRVWRINVTFEMKFPIGSREGCVTISMLLRLLQSWRLRLQYLPAPAVTRLTPGAWLHAAIR